jgi:multiple antibiotic resistance protein
MSITTAALTMFLVMDPLGNIPFFLSALQRVPVERHGAVVRRELLIAYGIMVVFLFAGGPLLTLLAISEEALTLAGGIILFLIAIRMVFPPPGGAHEEIHGEPFIVPLAIPYVAGPSVLATLMLFMKGDPLRWANWLAALTIAWAATAAILLTGNRLRTVLGPRTMVAIERLMGMILVAVAVQMFLSGLQRYMGRPA